MGLGFVHMVVSLVLETQMGIHERMEELERGRLRTYEGVVLGKPRVRRFWKGVCSWGQELREGGIVTGT
jgi:hypothetical protein